MPSRNPWVKYADIHQMKFFDCQSCNISWIGSCAREKFYQGKTALAAAHPGAPGARPSPVRGKIFVEPQPKTFSSSVRSGIKIQRQAAKSPRRKAFDWACHGFLCVFAPLR
jgi:hypothetical protein